MVRLGEKLREARLQRKLSLEEVAVATKIKPQFLEAIERDAYSELPSSAYAQGFVKNYAEYLGLSKVHTAALFKRDYDEKKAVKILPDGMNTKNNFPSKKINIRAIMIGLIAVILLIFFLFSQARNALIAPHISITSPKEGSIVTSEIDIIGKTDKNAIVTINNEPVFVQEGGEFRKMIILFVGNSSITVKAKNRAGRESVLKRNVIVKQ